MSKFSSKIILNGDHRRIAKELRLEKLEIEIMRVPVQKKANTGFQKLCYPGFFNFICFKNPQNGCPCMITDNYHDKLLLSVSHALFQRRLAFFSCDNKSLVSISKLRTRIYFAELQAMR